jgi:hypothetical protein
MASMQIPLRACLGVGDREAVEGRRAKTADFVVDPSVSPSDCHLPEQAQGGIYAR